MRRTALVLGLVMLHASASQQRAAASDREAGQQWLDRMSAHEAMTAGKAWLTRAVASRDFRETAWAEMMLKKSVADASAKQDIGTLAAAYFHLGRTLRLLGKVSEAKEALEQCAVLRPDDRAVLAQLGAVAEEAQEWNTAIEAFSRMADAAEAAGDDVLAQRGAATARASLGWVLFRAGRPEEALRAFRNASQRAPHDPQVYYRLARGMELLGGDNSVLYANTGAPFPLNRAFELSHLQPVAQAQQRPYSCCVGACTGRDCNGLERESPVGPCSLVSPS